MSHKKSCCWKALSLAKSGHGFILFIPFRGFKIRLVVLLLNALFVQR